MDLSLALRGAQVEDQPLGGMVSRGIRDPTGLTGKGCAEGGGVGEGEMEEGPREVGGKPVSTRSGRGVSLRSSQEKGVQQGQGVEKPSLTLKRAVSMMEGQEA